MEDLAAPGPERLAGVGAAMAAELLLTDGYCVGSVLATPSTGAAGGPDDVASAVTIHAVRIGESDARRTGRGRPVPTTACGEPLDETEPLVAIRRDESWRQWLDRAANSPALAGQTCATCSAALRRARWVDRWVPPGAAVR